jgi:UDP-N-acetylglucosamine 1-carboxyvinyltransferase
MTQILRIKGGKPLKGKVKISGAKNEVTKLMVASTLFDRPFYIENVPDIEDVRITADMLRRMGVDVAFRPDKHVIALNATRMSKHEAVFGEGKANRLSILLAGPLLHKFSKAVVEKPGGCRIGERPLDLHLYYLKQLGIDIEEDEYQISLNGKLTGGNIEFPYKSVGATEGALLASVYAKGTTVITNHANEPEIIELIKVLQQAGAMIEYDSEGRIKVTGVDYPLHVDHPIAVIGDRVEAISYFAAALATNGDITAEGIDQRHIFTALATLRRAGAKIDISNERIRVSRNGILLPLDIETDPHPALATDFQQVIAVLLSQSEGTSHIHETVYEHRFAYVEELNKLGGKFTVSTDCKPFKTCRFANKNAHMATVKGPAYYHGGEAEITDLRAAFALVMAGLLSDNVTKLQNVHHLMRGYDRVMQKLQSLGANVELLES